MALDLMAITMAAESHAAALGWFERVNRHEPKNAPGNGLSASIWVQSVVPSPAQSGLAATTVRIELSVRLLLPMLKDPQDEIDPELLGAADALMRAYSADFDLGGLVESIDLLGRHGIPMRGEAGYYNQDGKLFRGFVITLPVIVNDLWPQEA